MSDTTGAQDLPTASADLAAGPPQVTSSRRDTSAPTDSPAYVYALGRIEPRFPTPGVEKEFAQAMGRSDTSGLTDREALHALLTDRQNRYLTRQITWVFTIEGLETYLLTPRDPRDFDLLVESVRPLPRSSDVDVVIGARGPIAPPEAAGGLYLPVVVLEQLYSFDVDSLISSLPPPESLSAERFRPAAEEIFTRLVQIADNAGATNEHRALNYLAVRYPMVYERVATAHADETALTEVEVRTSRLAGARQIVDVIFSFAHRRTGAEEQSFVRVDVTEMFPYLVTKLSPYYRRQP